ncbi:MAG: 50S ribosomal protein L10 [Acidilobaceae archaeon]
MLVSRKKAKVQPWKIEVIKIIKELFTKHSTVAIIDISSIPTAQLQSIRRRLRDKIIFKVAKKTLILKALEELKVDSSIISNYLKGTTMLAFSNENPFRLYRIITSEKIPIEAKPGQKVDKEVVVPEGETSITPGPMLGVLGKLKIPYEVRGGKVYIKKATVVAKPGDTISPELASILLKLGIKPLEIGLDPLAVYDNGIVIPRENLRIDIVALKKEIEDTISEALQLAIGISYIELPEALQTLLVTSYREVDKLAETLAIPLPDIIEQAIIRAIREETLIITALGEKAKELGIQP